jgi:transposase-like protein
MRLERPNLTCGEHQGRVPVEYLNNVLEQDHRAIKRRVCGSQYFRSFWGAWRTIAGYEAIHMIRKGQDSKQRCKQGQYVPLSWPAFCL